MNETRIPVGDSGYYFQRGNRESYALFHVDCLGAFGGMSWSEHDARSFAAALRPKDGGSVREALEYVQKQLKHYTNPDFTMTPYYRKLTLKGILVKVDAALAQAPVAPPVVQEDASPLAALEGDVRGISEWTPEEIAAAQPTGSDEECARKILEDEQFNHLTTAGQKKPWIERIKEIATHLAAHRQAALAERDAEIERLVRALVKSRASHAKVIRALGHGDASDYGVPPAVDAIDIALASYKGGRTKEKAPA